MSRNRSTSASLNPQSAASGSESDSSSENETFLPTNFNEVMQKQLLQNVGVDLYHLDISYNNFINRANEMLIPLGLNPVTGVYILMLLKKAGVMRSPSYITMTECAKKLSNGDHYAANIEIANITREEMFTFTDYYNIKSCFYDTANCVAHIEMTAISLCNNLERFNDLLKGLSHTEMSKHRELAQALLNVNVPNNDTFSEKKNDISPRMINALSEVLDTIDFVSRQNKRITRITLAFTVLTEGLQPLINDYLKSSSLSQENQNYLSVSLFFEMVSISRKINNTELSLYENIVLLKEKIDHATELMNLADDNTNEHESVSAAASEGVYIESNLGTASPSSAAHLLHVAPASPARSDISSHSGLFSTDSSGSNSDNESYDSDAFTSSLEHSYRAISPAESNVAVSSSSDNYDDLDDSSSDNMGAFSGRTSSTEPSPRRAAQLRPVKYPVMFTPDPTVFDSASPATIFNTDNSHVPLCTDNPSDINNWKFSPSVENAVPSSLFFNEEAASLNVEDHRAFEEGVFDNHGMIAGETVTTASSDAGSEAGLTISGRLSPSFLDDHLSASSHRSHASMLLYINNAPPSPSDQDHLSSDRNFSSSLTEPYSTDSEATSDQDKYPTDLAQDEDFTLPVTPHYVFSSPRR